MSTNQKRRVELVGNPLEKPIKYLRYFMKIQRVPSERILPISERGVELRKLFSEADDEKVYPFLVMTEEVEDGETRVIFKALKPREKMLYRAVRIYNYGEEVLGENEK